MTIELGAVPQVQRAINKGLPNDVGKAFEAVKRRLQEDPWFCRADKKTVWSKVWPDVPNHRHADLPDAWRCCWTVRIKNDGVDYDVTVLFLGTHKEYDRLYGFHTT